MVNNIKIAPSTDPCKNDEDLIEYIKKISPYADLIHCDVMDSNFVYRSTINDFQVKKIYLNTSIPLDVHLMINEPKKLVEKYIRAGAQIVTVHFEAFKNKKDLVKTLCNIRKYGAMSGISINPSTQINEIFQFLCYCDLVLVMSVEPGLSGQKFIESSLNKIKKLQQIKESYNAKFLIEVDGGVNEKNADLIKECGADILVSGSYLYNAEDTKLSIQKLKQA